MQFMSGGANHATNQISDETCKDKQQGTQTDRI